MEKQQVKDVGGLFVLGTERHESRRIDNQLRGRSGRQGDPGLSRFYLCLEDDLLRIFGPDTLFARMMNANMGDGEAIGSKWLSKAIETAQRKVEARNYDVRKQVVEYDDVMNDQRKVIYEQRSDIMDAETVGDVLVDMRRETVNDIVGATCPAGTFPEQWNIPALKERVTDVLGLEPDIDGWLQEDAVEPELIEERLSAMADAAVAEKAATLSEQDWHSIEKSILLQNLDHHWKEHLATLDALRQVVHLRAYAQKTPINEYKAEAFGLFERMLGNIREDVTRTIARVQFQMEGAPDIPELPTLPDFITNYAEESFAPGVNADGFVTTRLPQMGGALPGTVGEESGGDPYAGQGISRNAACPCGSGKRYKHCHGALS
ncbi:MAG: hypothetical protein B7Z20_06715 [Sphingobium sp. 32-64-5]|nr:MAG: hypothetical protein B7Z20_06715 [Sphingobium sp. 32-64-5]